MRKDHSLPDDIRLLATLLRVWDDAHADAEWLSRADWDRLLLLARRHRVVPALAAGMERSGHVVPANVSATLRTGLQQAALEELGLAATTRRLVQRLGNAGIDAVVLKGVPLSLMIHGRLGLRVSRDIDLLVAPSVIGEAVVLLQREGFRIVGGQDPAAKDVEMVHDATRQIVELHVRLFDNPHLMPVEVAQDAVWTLLPLGVACFVLTERTNIVYLAMHGAQHGWSRLKWIVDLAWLLHGLGGEGRAQLYAGVTADGERRAVGLALLLCADLFDMPLPKSLLADRAGDRRLRWLHRLALHTLSHSAEREIEAIPFGSTAKNVSHYLLRSDLPYLMTEIRQDLAPSAADGNGRFSRWGIVGRIGSWLGRHWRLGRE